MIRDLQRRRARARRRLAVLEGVRLVEEALTAELHFRGAVVTPELERTARGSALGAALAARAVPFEMVTARTLAALADTETPQGVIAVVEPHRWSLTQLVLSRRAAVLALDGVQDPGNVGALVRTAHALGATATLALTGTADPLNPKALRGAMGSSFHHPVVATTRAEFGAWLESQHFELWLADTRGTPVGRVPRPPRVALAVGAEGAGLSDALSALRHRRVAVPLAGGAESLNVAVAAGILLYEVLRAE